MKTSENFSRWLMRLIAAKISPPPRTDNVSKGENNIRRVLKMLFKFMAWVTVIVVVFIYFFFPEKSTAFVCFTMVSIVSAYFLGGAALGFIFAIPKSAQRAIVVAQSPTPANTAQAQASGATPDMADYYKDNTSLEEISDWLTKIIIGLSFTQFDKLLSYVNEAARKIAAALTEAYAMQQGQTKVSFYVFAFACIVLYSISGLIIGYLWTRIDFPKILTQNKKDIEKISKLQEQNKALLNQVNKTEATKQTDEMKDESLRVLVNKILALKPVKDTADVNKNRWGTSVSGNIELSANVVQASAPGLYTVSIKVEMIDGSKFTDPVAIILHDSFSPMVRILNAAGLSSVSLDVIAYEAFTVAALANIKSEKEYTPLELDLNDEPDYPAGFYWGR